MIDLAQTSLPAQSLFSFTASDIVLVLTCVAGVLLPAIAALMKVYFDGKRMQNQVDDIKGDVKTASQATSALIDANKMNPATPDIDPTLEAAVKTNAAPTIDEDPPKGR